MRNLFLKIWKILSHSSIIHFIYTLLLSFFPAIGIYFNIGHSLVLGFSVIPVLLIIGLAIISHQIDDKINNIQLYSHDTDEKITIRLAAYLWEDESIPPGTNINNPAHVEQRIQQLKTALKKRDNFRFETSLLARLIAGNNNEIFIDQHTNIYVRDLEEFAIRNNYTRLLNALRRQS